MFTHHHCNFYIIQKLVVKKEVSKRLSYLKTWFHFVSYILNDNINYIDINSILPTE